MEKKVSDKTLSATILSLSLLTVMAGAAIAPALDVIQTHFLGTNPLWIQLLVCVPALFIIITSLVFPFLCRHFNTRTLVLASLLLYLSGGVAAFFCESIWMILSLRVLLGISVGILMPLSTGLLVLYFPVEKHSKLLGLSSAFNYLGAVLATLATGILSHISWNYAFLVYLMVWIAIIPCALFLPSRKLPTRKGNPFSSENIHTYKLYILSMLFASGIFFIYPTNFAIQAARDNYTVPPSLITAIMAFMDLIAMFMGVFYTNIFHALKGYIRYLSPATFLIGYAVLGSSPHVGWVIAGSVFVGIGAGTGIPYVFATASHKAGKEGTAVVMPLIAASLYLAQFCIPFLVHSGDLLLSDTVRKPYIVAVVLSLLMLAYNHWKRHTPESRT